MINMLYKVSVNVRPEHAKRGKPNRFAGIVRAGNPDEALRLFRAESGVSCWGAFCMAGGAVQAMNDDERATPLKRGQLEFTGGWSTYHDKTADEILAARPFDKEHDGNTITIITPWEDNSNIRFN